MTIPKTCPFEASLAANGNFNGSVNPSPRLGDHECQVSTCKFNEGGCICRINATYNYERANNELLQKIAKQLHINLNY